MSAGEDRIGSEAAHDMIIVRGHGVVAALAGLALAAVAAPVRANSVTALEGSWTVAQATVNGALRADGKVLNATWTFRGPELVMQNVNGERLRSALSFDATAEPPAFHVTPIDPPGERPLWISGSDEATNYAWPSTTESTAAPRTSVPGTSSWC